MSKDFRKAVAPKNASKKATKVRVNVGGISGGSLPEDYTAPSGPRFAKGGSINGCASRGHTKGKRM